MVEIDKIHEKDINKEAEQLDLWGDKCERF